MRTPSARAMSIAVSVAASVGLGSLIALSTAAPAAATTYSTPQQVAGAPANPMDGIVFNDVLYFNGGDADGARRLYSFDGSTFTLVDLTHTGPEYFTIANNVLYYTAMDVNNVWQLMAVGGNNPGEQGINSANGAIQSAALPNTNGLIVSMPLTPSVTRLLTWLPAGNSVIDDLAYVDALVPFGDSVYFTGLRPGDTENALMRTDGVTVTTVQQWPGVNKTVWQGAMYFGLIGSDYGFSKLTTSGDLTPGADPNPTYARWFTDAGDVLYFTASGYADDAVYSYDGTTVTATPGSPLRASNFTMVGDTLFVMGDMNTSIRICSLDAGLECADYGHIYAYDRSSWTWIADTTGNPMSLMSYGGRLYFDEGDRWMVVERLPEPTLPNTGLDVLPAGLTFGALALLGAGLVLVRRQLSRKTAG